jgi:hypothetical protein
MWNNSNRIGVVIQGPVISQGFNGSNWCRRHNKEKIKFESFDASSYISDSYLELKKYFDDVILVTWTEQPIDKLLKVIPKIDILVIDQPVEMLLKIRRKLVGSWNTHNSKILQFYSVLHGLLELERRGCTHAFKQRSDQKLQPKKIYDFLNKQFKNQDSSNKIYLPLAVSDRPNWAQDFYFAGRLDPLITLSKRIIFGRELYPLVHTDLFYKMYNLNEVKSYDNFLQLILQYFPKGKYESMTYGQQSLIRRVWAKNLGVFPKSIWYGLLWRGEGMPKCLNLHSEQIFEIPRFTTHKSKYKTKRVLSFFNINFKFLCAYLFGWKLARIFEILIKLKSLFGRK